MKNFVSLLLILGFSIQLLAQKKFPDHPENLPEETSRAKGKALLVTVAAGGHLPGGDLKSRFENNGSVGGQLEFLAANNFSLGADFNFFYGKNVLEDPLARIRNDSGFIIGNGKSLASVVLRQRGFYLGGHVAKLFQFSPDSRSGIRVALGVGVTRHKIRVQDDSRSVTQLTGDYAKGYDRLTGGLSLNQFVGYQILSKNKRINMFIGFDFNEGFTRSLRDWDFDQKKKLEGGRFDFRYGFRAGWTLPFYIGGAEKIYY